MVRQRTLILLSLWFLPIFLSGCSISGNPSQTDLSLNRSPAAGVPAGWQAYQSETLGLTLQYPSDWQLRTDFPGCGVAFFAPDTHQRVWFTVCGPYVNQEEAPQKLAEQAVSPTDKLLGRETFTLAGNQAVKQQLQSDSMLVTQVYIGEVPAMVNQTPVTGTAGLYFYKDSQYTDPQIQTVFDRIIASVALKPVGQNPTSK